MGGFLFWVFRHESSGDLTPFSTKAGYLFFRRGFADQSGDSGWTGSERDGELQIVWEVYRGDEGSALF
jgi:hypothetical protein